MWTKPAATEMRFGFEVTMYIMNKQCIIISAVRTSDARKEGNNIKLWLGFTSETCGRTGLRTYWVINPTYFRFQLRKL